MSNLQCVSTLLQRADANLARVRDWKAPTTSGTRQDVSLEWNAFKLEMKAEREEELQNFRAYLVVSEKKLVEMQNMEGELEKKMVEMVRSYVGTAVADWKRQFGQPRENVELKLLVNKVNDMDKQMKELSRPDFSHEEIKRSVAQISSRFGILSDKLDNVTQEKENMKCDFDLRLTQLEGEYKDKMQAKQVEESQFDELRRKQNCLASEISVALKSFERSMERDDALENRMRLSEVETEIVKQKYEALTEHTRSEVQTIKMELVKLEEQMMKSFAAEVTDLRREITEQCELLTSHHSALSKELTESQETNKHRYESIEEKIGQMRERSDKGTKEMKDELLGDMEKQKEQLEKLEYTMKSSMLDTIAEMRKQTDDLSTQMKEMKSDAKTDEQPVVVPVELDEKLAGLESRQYCNEQQITQVYAEHQALFTEMQENIKARLESVEYHYGALVQATEAAAAAAAAAPAGVYQEPPSRTPSHHSGTPAGSVRGEQQAAGAPVPATHEEEDTSLPLIGTPVSRSHEDVDLSSPQVVDEVGSETPKEQHGEDTSLTTHYSAQQVLEESEQGSEVRGRENLKNGPKRGDKSSDKIRENGGEESSEGGRHKDESSFHPLVGKLEALEVQIADLRELHLLGPQFTQLSERVDSIQSTIDSAAGFDVPPTREATQGGKGPRPHTQDPEGLEDIMWDIDTPPASPLVGGEGEPSFPPLVAGVPPALASVALAQRVKVCEQRLQTVDFVDFAALSACEEKMRMLDWDKVVKKMEGDTDNTLNAQNEEQRSGKDAHESGEAAYQKLEETILHIDVNRIEEVEEKLQALAYVDLPALDEKMEKLVDEVGGRIGEQIEQAMREAGYAKKHHGREGGEEEEDAYVGVNPETHTTVVNPREDETVLGVRLASCEEKLEQISSLTEEDARALSSRLTACEEKMEHVSDFTKEKLERELSARFATIEKKLEQVSTPTKDDEKYLPLSTRLATCEANLEQVSNLNADDIRTLSTRVAKCETNLEQVSNLNADDIRALSTRLGTCEEKLATTQSSGLSEEDISASRALSTRVATCEERIEEYTIQGELILERVAACQRELHGDHDGEDEEKMTITRRVKACEEMMKREGTIIVEDGKELERATTVTATTAATTTEELLLPFKSLEEEVKGMKEGMEQQESEIDKLQSHVLDLQTDVGDLQEKLEEKQKLESNNAAPRSAGLDNISVSEDKRSASGDTHGAVAGGTASFSTAVLPQHVERVDHIETQLGNLRKESEDTVRELSQKFDHKVLEWDAERIKTHDRLQVIEEGYKSTAVNNKARKVGNEDEKDGKEHKEEEKEELVFQPKPRDALGHTFDIEALAAAAAAHQQAGDDASSGIISTHGSARTHTLGMSPRKEEDLRDAVLQILVQIKESELENGGKDKSTLPASMTATSSFPGIKKKEEVTQGETSHKNQKEQLQKTENSISGSEARVEARVEDMEQNWLNKWELVDQMKTQLRHMEEKHETFCADVGARIDTVDDISTQVEELWERLLLSEHTCAQVEGMSLSVDAMSQRLDILDGGDGEETGIVEGRMQASRGELDALGTRLHLLEETVMMKQHTHVLSADDQSRVQALEAFVEQCVKEKGDIMYEGGLVHQTEVFTGRIVGMEERIEALNRKIEALNQREEEQETLKKNSSSSSKSGCGDAPEGAAHRSVLAQTQKKLHMVDQENHALKQRMLQFHIKLEKLDAARGDAHAAAEGPGAATLPAIRDMPMHNRVQLLEHEKDRLSDDFFHIERRILQVEQQMLDLVTPRALGGEQQLHTNTSTTSFSAAAPYPVPDRWDPIDRALSDDSGFFERSEGGEIIDALDLGLMSGNFEGEDMDGSLKQPSPRGHKTQEEPKNKDDEGVGGKKQPLPTIDPKNEDDDSNDIFRKRTSVRGTKVGPQDANKTEDSATEKSVALASGPLDVSRRSCTSSLSFSSSPNISYSRASSPVKKGEEEAWKSDISNYGKKNQRDLLIKPTEDDDSVVAHDDAGEDKNSSSDLDFTGLAVVHDGKQDDRLIREKKAAALSRSNSHSQHSGMSTPGEGADKTLFHSLSVSDLGAGDSTQYGGGMAAKPAQRSEKTATCDDIYADGAKKKSGDENAYPPDDIYAAEEGGRQELELSINALRKDSESLTKKLHPLGKEGDLGKDSESSSSSVSSAHDGTHKTEKSKKSEKSEKSPKEETMSPERVTGAATEKGSPEEEKKSVASSSVYSPWGTKIGKAMPKEGTMSPERVTGAAKEKGSPEEEKKSVASSSVYSPWGTKIGKLIPEQEKDKDKSSTDQDKSLVGGARQKSQEEEEENAKKSYKVNVDLEEDEEIEEHIGSSSFSPSSFNSSTLPLSFSTDRKNDDTSRRGGDGPGAHAHDADDDDDDDEGNKSANKSQEPMNMFHEPTHAKGRPSTASSADAPQWGDRKGETTDATGGSSVGHSLSSLSHAKQSMNSKVHMNAMNSSKEDKKASERSGGGDKPVSLGGLPELKKVSGARMMPMPDVPAYRVGTNDEEEEKDALSSLLASHHAASSGAPRGGAGRDNEQRSSPCPVPSSTSPLPRSKEDGHSSSNSFDELVMEYDDEPWFADLEVNPLDVTVSKSSRRQNGIHAHRTGHEKNSTYDESEHPMQSYAHGHAPPAPSTMGRTMRNSTHPRISAQPHARASSRPFQPEDDSTSSMSDISALLGESSRSTHLARPNTTMDVTRRVEYKTVNG